MKKIVSTNDVLFGMPRINGRRISVYNIVSNLWHSRDIKEYCDLFELSEEDVLNALFYCKELKCQKTSVIQFCDGCLLRTINEKNNKSFIKKISEGVFIDENSNYYVYENQKEIDNEEFGYMGWMEAEILFNEFS